MILYAQECTLYEDPMTLCTLYEDTMHIIGGHYAHCTVGGDNMILYAQVL